MSERAGGYFIELLAAASALTSVAVGGGWLLPEVKRAGTGRWAFVVAGVGLALALHWAAVMVREPRGGWEMLLFAVPAFVLAAAFHAVFWTGDAPGTGKLVALWVLAALVLLWRGALFFFDALAAG